jgi:predicted nucleic acid-binding protein
MILLDANVIIRLLTVPDSPATLRMTSVVAGLFRAIESGESEAMVSDAVLAEVAFMLTSPRHFGMEVPEVAGKLSAILQLRSLRVSDRQVLLYALALWAERPKLGFVDSLTATQARRLNVELLTFDSDFDGIDGIRLWAGPAT